MFTRLAQRRRPRRPVFVLITAAAVAALLASGVALALISDGPGTFDVTVASNATSRTADLGNATVEYIGSSASNQSSGTGLFDPFVRLQGSPTEAGYNTCSQSSCGGDVTEFQSKTGSWTHAIPASAIPTVDCGGDLVGTSCWELFNDINEGNSAKYLSLNEVEVWLTTNARLTGYDATTGFVGATKVYDFTGSILIHDVNQGSGRGDLRYLIPVQPFNAGDLFVLYSKWGTTTGTAPDGKTWGSEGGFEEWKVRKAPSLQITKVADAATVSAGTSIGFVVTITNNGPADATGVTITDTLPGGPGIDWSENSASCAISGSPGTPPEVLTCGPVTLAANGGSLTVHLTSPTTAASCGTYNNTANFTSTNAGSGSATDLTAVQCGALVIHKNTTKGTDQRVSAAGAVFGVDGPDAGTVPDFSVTDDVTAAAPDEDADIGEVCVTGLAPGAYTVTETSPPAGYGAGSPAAGQSVTVVSGTTCSSATVATATFTNPPLADIQVIVTDAGSGDTNSSIVCAEGATTIPADAEDGDPDPAFDDTDETFSDLDPGTYTCTVIIDP